MFDEACSSKTNPWRLSDYERNTREIQSVTCSSGIFAQDHAFEPIKNYQKQVGATAAWTSGTGTGETAAVALVPLTKTEDFAHASKQLTQRKNCVQNFMYSNTWPNKEDFWLQIHGVKGQLGLFHYEQRILRTLKRNMLIVQGHVLTFWRAFIPTTRRIMRRGLKPSKKEGCHQKEQSALQLRFPRCRLVNCSVKDILSTFGK